MSELHPSKRENRKARPAGIVSDRRTSAKPVGEFAPTVPSESVALKSVGSFLRTAREALGLTQDQLALKTSQNPWPVSRAMIGAIEQGKHAPNPFTLLGISQVLRIDPMEVFDRLKLAVARPKEVAGRDYAALDQLFKDTFASGDFRRSLAILDATMDQLVGSGSSSEETMHRRTLVELRRATTLRRLGALTAARAAAERVLSAPGSDAALLRTATPFWPQFFRVWASIGWRSMRLSEPSRRRRRTLRPYRVVPGWKRDMFCSRLAASMRPTRPTSRRSGCLKQAAT